MTTKYALFSFCFHLKFDTLVYLLPNHICKLNGANVIIKDAFNVAQMKENSSQKRTHRNNFKYTCALHSMTII